jgi:DNA-binding NarL/FixJ family response regulator
VDEHGQAETGERAEDLRERTRDTLDQTRRMFQSMADKARERGDSQGTVRFEHLASAAEHATARVAGVGQRGTAKPRGPASSPTTTRVLLVDDHELAREALRAVLTPEQGFQIVGEADTGETAVQLAHRLRPHLVLMDVRMPGMDGVAATRAILAELPATRVVILTSHEQRPIVLQAMRAGAAGYLTKGATSQELLATVRAALGGERRVQASLAADLLSQDAQGDTPVGAPQLSERELEVLQLMAAGQSNAGIAYALSVSLNTAKTHVQHLLRKLDAVDRASAVARAAALGLLSETPPPVR